VGGTHNVHNRCAIHNLRLKTMSNAVFTQQIAFWTTLVFGLVFATVGLVLGLRKKRQPKLFLLVIFAAVCFVALSLRWK